MLSLTSGACEHQLELKNVNLKSRGLFIDQEHGWLLVNVG